MTEPTPEPVSLPGEASALALTQTGGIRTLASLVAVLAAQVDALDARITALEPAPTDPTPSPEETP